MKKIILTSIVFLSLVVFAFAQPLPPTTPSGNPVPIGGFLLLLLSLSGVFLFLKKRNKK
ncbi:MAG: LPXTG cell wall anchor domain-containing protein [Prolixibacteraceae bacterium]